MQVAKVKVQPLPVGSLLLGSPLDRPRESGGGKKHGAKSLPTNATVQSTITSSKAGLKNDRGKFDTCEPVECSKRKMKVVLYLQLTSPAFFFFFIG